MRPSVSSPSAAPGRLAKQQFQQSDSDRLQQAEQSGSAHALGAMGQLRKQSPGPEAASADNILAELLGAAASDKHPAESGLQPSATSASTHEAGAPAVASSASGQLQSGSLRQDLTQSDESSTDILEELLAAAGNSQSRVLAAEPFETHGAQQDHPGLHLHADEEDILEELLSGRSTSSQQRQSGGLNSQEKASPAHSSSSVGLSRGPEVSSIREGNSRAAAQQEDDRPQLLPQGRPQPRGRSQASDTTSSPEGILIILMQLLVWIHLWLVTLLSAASAMPCKVD